MTVRYCAIVLIPYAVMPGLYAGNLNELRVAESGGIYNVKMVMMVDVPAEYVRAVLTGYVRICRLNPSITESEVLPSPEDSVARVRTVMTGCVALFCREVTRVEDVLKLRSGDLQAVIVPELSSLRSGTAEWNIQRMGKHTRVTCQAHMEPDFFIPPLIGSHFVKKNIRTELLASFAMFECMAQIKARLDRLPHLQLASLGTDAGCGERCGNIGTECRR